MLTATDYYNSYYGRLAREASGARQRAGDRRRRRPRRGSRQTASFPTGTGSPLIAVGLNREALNELQYAQRVWGDSPPLQATIALVHNRLGNLRAGINAMKRAYPQYLAAGGETLPVEILQGASSRSTTGR